MLRLGRPSAAPACYGADPTPADHAIQPRSPVRGVRYWQGVLGRAHHGAQAVEGLRHVIAACEASMVLCSST